MAIPKIYKNFYEKGVFSFEEVVNKYKTVNTVYSLRTMIRDCKKRGYIGTVKRSLYYIIPIGSSKKDYTVDKYLIASKIAKKGVIAYHSALELCGVAQSIFNKVFILTNQSISPFKFQGVIYIGVQGCLDFGTTFIYRQGIAIKVTDREKTIIDCLDRIKYSGGLEEFLKSIESFPSIDFKNVKNYLNKYKKINLYCKMGYILTLFAKEWTFPKDLKEEIASRMARKIYYLNNKRKKGKLIKEWNLIVPEDVDELIKGV